MFGLGYQELLIILVIVLVLFGANRLPELARSLGSSMKEFKKGVNEGGKEETTTPARKEEEKKVQPPKLARAFLSIERARRWGSRILHSRDARQGRPLGLSACRRPRPPHGSLPAALPRAHALQLGRRAVCAGAARVRRRQAPAASAGLHPLCRPRPYRERMAARSDRGVCAAGGGLQRPHHVRRVPARARDLRPRDGPGGGQRARGQPALLVLRIGRAHLRRRGAVRLDRGVLRVSCAGGERGRRVARRRVSGAGGGHATVAAAAAAAGVARRLRARPGAG